MTYNHNMSDETRPNIKRLIPEGWQSFQIESCVEATAKSGNAMFIVGLLKKDMNYVEMIYLVAEKGKRWMLKKLLTACGVEAGQDGVYEWDIDQILNKDIRGLVQHEDSEWINREGETIKKKQNRISDFETIAWDEND